MRITPLCVPPTLFWALHTYVPESSMVRFSSFNSNFTCDMVKCFRFNVGCLYLLSFMRTPGLFDDTLREKSQRNFVSSSCVNTIQWITTSVPT